MESSRDDAISLRSAELHRLCESCGYNLAALVDPRCPECGRPFDPAVLPLPRIPWIHRATIGSFPAYFLTAWMACVHPASFAKEFVRHVRLGDHDAREFRAWTIRLTVAVICAGPAIYLLALEGFLGLVGGAVIALVAFPALLVFLEQCTKMPSYLVERIEWGPWGIGCLHYYAGAPLALMPIIIPLAVASALLPGMAGHLLEIIVAGLAILMCGLLWAIPVIFLNISTRCPERLLIKYAAVVPLIWLKSIFLLVGIGAVVIGAALSCAAMGFY